MKKKPAAGNRKFGRKRAAQYTAFLAWWPLVLCGLLIPSTAFAQSDYYTDFVTAIEGETEGESESTEATQTTTSVTPVATSTFGVAVLDTGVAMVAPITPTVMVPGSASFVGGNPLVDYAQQGTHGTAVAQMIRTLSPASGILSLQTSKGGRSISGSAVAQALRYAAANPSIRVINHSNAALAAVPGDAILATALADQVVVMGAGNHGKASPRGDARHAPGLGGKGLIVGGLGPSGEMLGVSNRAGEYAQHYVVATGGSGFAHYWGTSFAAPRVSALAAQLRQRWPELRAEQVTEIIKRSSTDMGASGVDAVYGWGQINPVRAFQPLGALTTPTGSSTTETNDEKEESADRVDDDFQMRRLKIGTPIYSALAQQAFLSKVLAVDRYGRDFSLELSKMVSESDSRSNARRIAADWAIGWEPVLLSDGPGYRLFSDLEANSIGAPKLHFNVVGNDAYSHQLSYSARPYQRNGAVNWLPRLENDATAGSAWQRGLVGSDLEEGFHSLSTYQLGPIAKLDLAFSDTQDSESSDQQNQRWSSAVHFVTDDIGVTFEGGLLEEKGSLYGGAPGGALSVGSADTRFIRLSGYHRLNLNVALIAAYTGALTDVDADPNKLLGNFSDLSAEAWLFGVGAKGIFSSQDAASLTVSQPLRASSGSADLDVAYALGSGGQVLRHQEKISLVPAGSETLLELIYRIRWSPMLELGAYGSLRYEANHDRNAGIRPQLMTVARGTF